MMSLKQMVKLGLLDADEAAEIAFEWQREADDERAYYHNLATSYRMRSLGLLPHNFQVADASLPF